MTFLRAIPRPAVSLAKRMFNVRPVLLFDEDYRGREEYAAEQEVSEDDALKAGMEQKSREFAETRAELYSKA